MPVLTVEGTYKDGKVELAEMPDSITEARVYVTFLPEAAVAARPATAVGDAAAQARREAAKRMLEDMRRGIDFGGEKFDRNEIYEERMRELDERRERHR